MDKILNDNVSEIPKAKMMSFTAIKQVLVNRYKIDTQPAGLFFWNQIRAYHTEDGNPKLKMAIQN